VTGLDLRLGLVSFGLGLAGLGWPRPRSHCLMVSLASLVFSLVLLHTLTRRTSDFTRHQEQRRTRCVWGGWRRLTTVIFWLLPLTFESCLRSSATSPCIDQPTSPIPTNQSINQSIASSQ